MKSHFYHIQINIDYTNVGFYKELMTFLGWKEIWEGEDLIGFRSHTSGDLWNVEMGSKEKQNYDHLGMNHISIRTETAADIDAIVAYLKEKNIKTLFDTPKHRPEFASEENETYYQVMFESPDKILYEIVFIGQK